MSLRIFVQRWEHDRQYHGRVITDKTHDVLVVPIIQRSFCHLQDGHFWSWSVRGQRSQSQQTLAIAKGELTIRGPLTSIPS